MYRPSCEQRGLKRFSEPGTSEICEVFKSTTWMFGPDTASYSSQGMPANTMESPLGIHVGSPWLRSPDVTSFGVPPSAGVTKIFHGLPGREAMNAIWVPSGDQRGMCACMGAWVSWVRELPSILLRHSV